MAPDLRLIRMPKQGLYRAGRWADVVNFPPPADPIPNLYSAGEPLVDGYPRWEDAFGIFSTAKLSASPEAAIGRTLAGYRLAERGGAGMIDRIKGFFVSEPDNPAEPELIENTIPPSYFEEAYRLSIACDESLWFVDVEHQRTRNTLATVLSGPLSIFDAEIDAGLSQNRDRRVTRLVMSTLYDICRGDPAFENVAGIRYKAPEPHWDAYVLWRPPELLELHKVKVVEPIFPEDNDLKKAAKTLGLNVPAIP
jgi:hypothetical protein